jgi:hypothetical protein
MSRVRPASYKVDVPIDGNFLEAESAKIAPKHWTLPSEDS